MKCRWCNQPIGADYPAKEEQTAYGTIYFHKLFFHDCWDEYQDAKAKLEAIRAGKEVVCSVPIAIVK